MYKLHDLFSEQSVYDLSLKIGYQALWLNHNAAFNEKLVIMNGLVRK